VAARLSILVAGLALLLAGGCGFHLRGAVQVPADLNPLYIQAPSRSPVRRALEDQLIGSGVQLTDVPTQARLILRIIGEQSDSEVAAVGADGRVLAFQLHYLVTFDAVGANGESRVPRRTLDLVQTFDNPDAEVLGKQQEEEMIYTDFAFDAADRILMVLRAVLT